MVELILVRHGETDSNLKGTYLGWTDIELNQKGLRQASLVAEQLKKLDIDRIYSSPLKRACKTAEVINEHFDHKIMYSDCLKERNFGVWDNLTYQEIVEGYPKEHSEWMEDWINYNIKGGESAFESSSRVANFTNSIISGKDEGKIIVVTHLGTIRFMLAHLLGMKLEDSWRFRVDNCSITRLEIKDGYAVLTHLNCSSIG